MSALWGAQKWPKSPLSDVKLIQGLHRRGTISLLSFFKYSNLTVMQLEQLQEHQQSSYGCLNVHSKLLNIFDTNIGALWKALKGSFRAFQSAPMLVSNILR